MFRILDDVVSQFERNKNEREMRHLPVGVSATQRLSRSRSNGSPETSTRRKKFDEPASRCLLPNWPGRKPDLKIWVRLAVEPPPHRPTTAGKRFLRRGTPETLTSYPETLQTVNTRRSTAVGTAPRRRCCANLDVAADALRKASFNARRYQTTNPEGKVRVIEGMPRDPPPLPSSSPLA